MIKYPSLNLSNAVTFSTPILLATLIFCIITPSKAGNVNAKIPPKRIISLSPGITEILFALGLGDKIVGDTVYCDYPPAAKTKTRIGDLIPNYEELVALKPDLILADRLANESSIPKIKSMELPIGEYPFDTLQDVETSIGLIGDLTNRKPQAKALVATMQRKEQQARQVILKQRQPIRYVFLVGTKPLWVAGKRAFIASLLDTIGADDVAPDTSYQAWSMESLIAAQPNVIFCSPDDKKAISSDPAWQAVPAVQHGNLFVVDTDTTERPGPRLTDGLLQLSKQLAGAKL